MPKLSAKRQITLPISHCQELDIQPGDDVDIYVHQGRITIVKLTPGRAAGVLKASRDQALARRSRRSSRTRGGG